ncbi:MAG TPA: nitrite reductase small subunit NirD [Polyangia bacterium]|nr:nitrite reductase small subunit NirD [Polyangia bacterium]
MSVAVHVEEPAAADPGLVWIDTCALDDISPATGVAALIGDRQIALIRPDEGERVYGLSNYDPFSQAFVISRGIVGDRGGRLKIASPIYKQTFDLETGACFEDPLVKLPVYPVRVRDGRVEIGIAP